MGNARLNQHRPLRQSKRAPANLRPRPLVHHVVRRSDRKAIRRRPGPSPRPRPAERPLRQDRRNSTRPQSLHQRPDHRPIHPAQPPTREPKNGKRKRQAHRHVVPMQHRAASGRARHPASRRGRNQIALRRLKTAQAHPQPVPTVHPGARLAPLRRRQKGPVASHILGPVQRALDSELYFPITCLAITSFWISLAPSPISVSFASRHSFSMR